MMQDNVLVTQLTHAFDLDPDFPANTIGRDIALGHLVFAWLQVKQVRLFRLLFQLVSQLEFIDIRRVVSM